MVRPPRRGEAAGRAGNGASRAARTASGRPAKSACISWAYRTTTTLCGRWRCALPWRCRVTRSGSPVPARWPWRSKWIAGCWRMRIIHIEVQSACGPRASLFERRCKQMAQMHADWSIQSAVVPFTSVKFLLRTGIISYKRNQIRMADCIPSQFHMALKFQAETVKNPLNKPLSAESSRVLLKGAAGRKRTCSDLRSGLSTSRRSSAFIRFICLHLRSDFRSFRQHGREQSPLFRRLRGASPTSMPRDAGGPSPTRALSIGPLMISPRRRPVRPDGRA
jgi:hypothetical protein